MWLMWPPVIWPICDGVIKNSYCVSPVLLFPLLLSKSFRLILTNYSSFFSSGYYLSYGSYVSSSLFFDVALSMILCMPF